MEIYITRISLLYFAELRSPRPVYVDSIKVVPPAEFSATNLFPGWRKATLSIRLGVPAAVPLVQFGAEKGLQEGWQQLCARPCLACLWATQEYSRREGMLSVLAFQVHSDVMICGS